MEFLIKTYTPRIIIDPDYTLIANLSNNHQISVHYAYLQNCARGETYTNKASRTTLRTTRMVNNHIHFFLLTDRIVFNIFSSFFLTTRIVNEQFLTIPCNQDGKCFFSFFPPNNTDGKSQRSFLALIPTVLKPLETLLFPKKPEWKTSTFLSAIPVTLLLFIFFHCFLFEIIRLFINQLLGNCEV